MKNCPICDAQGKIVGMPMSIQWCDDHGLFSSLFGEHYGFIKEEEQ
jgi:hypothetical protein